MVPKDTLNYTQPYDRALPFLSKYVHYVS